MAAGELDFALRELISEYGYNEYKLSWVPTKDFKSSARAIGKKIELNITDYFQNEDNMLVLRTAEMLIRQIGHYPKIYPKDYVEYIDSDDFILRHRNTFLKRSKNITCSNIGKNRDLIDSVQRLLDSQLLDEEDISNSYLTWTKTPNHRKIGYAVSVVRIIAISSLLDSQEIPDSVVDYVVYHEFLHLRRGFDPNHKPHDRQVRTWESAYPGMNDMEIRLRKICGVK